jgi:hypothetical protein
MRWRCRGWLWVRLIIRLKRLFKSQMATILSVTGKHPALNYRGNAIRRDNIWLQSEYDQGLKRYGYTGWQWKVSGGTKRHSSIPVTSENERARTSENERERARTNERERARTSENERERARTSENERERARTSENERARTSERERASENERATGHENERL